MGVQEGFAATTPEGAYEATKSGHQRNWSLRAQALTGGRGKGAILTMVSKVITELSLFPKKRSRGLGCRDVTP